MQFFVRHLPKSVITSNRTAQSNTGARGKWAERAELQAETALAIQATYQQAIPKFQRAATAITYMHTFKKPGDGLYRPRDPWNIGGDIAKAVIDGIVDMGVLPDDDWTHIASGTVMIEKVDEIADEGILVTVEPLL